MRRYIFLMLAFFLAFHAHAYMGFALPPVSASPQAMANVNKESSLKKRDLRVLGNIKESEEKADQPSEQVPIGTISATKPYKKPMNSKVITQASCRSYDDKVYDSGESGYNDCVEKIKTDRKETRTTK